MILTSHQPNFLPYMGVIYKIYKSDILVLSDDVWFSKKGMHNWNYIISQNGIQKITIPVNAHHDTSLKNVLISEPEVNIAKVVKTLTQAYSKSEHFEEGNEILDIIKTQAKPGTSLTEMNSSILSHVIIKMGLNAKLLIASKDLDITGHKDERILKMCEQTNSDVYYSGKGAAIYHIEELYKKRGIELRYSDYEPVRYHQRSKEFIYNMSMFDYICNEGYKIPEVWNEK